MKIKKGDNIIVRAGKDKGKTGTVAEVLRDRDQVVIDGVNVQTKHMKNRRVRSQGQVVTRPAPVHVSNVALVEDGKAVRAGYTVKDDGTKVRVSKKSGKEI